MTILVTGASGYIGYPLMLELREKTKHKIIGVDNSNRIKWVERTEGMGMLYPCHDPIVHGDLTNRDLVNELLSIHRPDVIIHLASQPSMPYSQINGERALFTQVNNLSILLNLLWGIKGHGLKTRLILTTTTGIPGQFYETVPENYTLNQAGSWYHISRGFDSANCLLACRQWGLQVIEFRTSIVYGIQTNLMMELGLTTRFDTDPYFGTVVNRFVHQVINKEPITIYGKGKQTKPFISLEDTVHSLVNAITYKFPKGHTILNQVTEMCSIERLAGMIRDWTNTQIKCIPNPRKEKETFKMTFKNDKFLKVLRQKPKLMDVGIGQMIAYLADRK